jgi:hypothetical protein
VTVTRWASAARTSLGKVLIPSPPKLIGVAPHQRLHLFDLGPAKPAALGQTDWIKPELGQVRFPFDVHVSRLVSVRRRRTTDKVRSEGPSAWKRLYATVNHDTLSCLDDSSVPAEQRNAPTADDVSSAGPRCPALGGSLPGERSRERDAGRPANREEPADIVEALRQQASQKTRPSS